MKEIIIFHEKYGDRYFDASTNELRNAACLFVLRERFRNYYYSYNNIDRPSNENILSEEQIASLPTENLRFQELLKRRCYLKELREFEVKIKFYERTKLAVETKDQKAAYQLLLQRSDGEYEGFDVEKLEETNLQ